MSSFASIVFVVTWVNFSLEFQFLFISPTFCSMRNLILGLHLISVVLRFSEPDVVVFPEPWILYTAVLLVPLATLVGLLTAMLMCRN